MRTPKDYMITDAQRRAIFAWGRANGMSIEDLRAMTPAGSISKMTRDQASKLIDRLNREQQAKRPRRRKRRPKNVFAIATEEQRAKIDSLRLTLGWSPEKLDAWLSKRHFLDGRPMNKIDSSDDAVRVIELLKGVIKRTDPAKLKRQRSADHVSAA